MTPRVQQGFTLIELMIVVAIIAILASIALGAYQDYIIRTQIGECSSLAGPIQIAAVEYHSNFGTFPTSNVQAGTFAPGQVQGTYVSRVEILPTGDLACVFSSAAPQSANAEIDGASMIWTPVEADGSVYWECSSTTISTYRLASLCR